MTAIADPVQVQAVEAHSKPRQPSVRATASPRAMASLGATAPYCPPDKLTAIQGIGIIGENRLYRAGIRSFAQLAATTPERLELILGDPRPGSSYESLIADARKLAG